MTTLTELTLTNNMKIFARSRLTTKTTAIPPPCILLLTLVAGVRVAVDLVLIGWARFIPQELLICPPAAAVWSGFRLNVLVFDLTLRCWCWTPFRFQPRLIFRQCDPGVHTAAFSQSFPRFVHGRSTLHRTNQVRGIARIPVHLAVKSSNNCPDTSPNHARMSHGR